MSRNNIDTHTRLCALFGHPVEHSFSPAMHNSAFSHLRLNYVYAAFDVLPRHLEVAVHAVKALNLAGANVTIPHKEKVIPYLDDLDSSARLNGAVNTIVNREYRLTGYNTDGPGFGRSLEQDCCFSPQNKIVLLIGAGGAAKAVGMHLGMSGVAILGILNRNPQRGKMVAEKINTATGIPTENLPWPREKHPVQEGDLVRFFRSAHLVVNCTSMGMQGCGTQLPPLPYHLASPGQLAYDLVYNPAETRFMQKFAQNGCRVFNGTGMLIHQGTLAFELWTGRKAPVEIMRRALGPYRKDTG